MASHDSGAWEDCWEVEWSNKQEPVGLPTKPTVACKVQTVQRKVGGVRESSHSSACIIRRYGEETWTLVEFLQKRTGCVNCSEYCRQHLAGTVVSRCYHN